MPRLDASLNRLDLRGIPCPMNFIKAKLYLDKLAQGDLVELFLDDGEPFDNVSTSVKEEGHSCEQTAEGYHKVVIEKI